MAQHEDPTQPGVSKTELAQVIRQVEREQTRRRVGRRVLLIGAGAAACAGAGIGAYELAPKIADGVKNQLGNDFAAGVDAGRKALAQELMALEEIALDDAIIVADLTEFGAVNIVRPLANFVSTIAADGLHLIAQAFKTGSDALSHLNLNPAWLYDLANLLQGWSDNVSQSKLGDFIAKDVTLADTYLKLLRVKLQEEAHPGATPSATSAATSTSTPAS